MKVCKIFITWTLIILFAGGSSAQTIPIWSSKAFTVYADSIVQGKFTATALSATELRSNYQSPANLYQSSKITFKFSINGKDNEMQPGMDHQYDVSGFSNSTPIITFGEQLKDGKPSSTYLQANANLIIRVDMRKVLSDFATKGYYITYKGDKIFKEDFKGVYVAGGTAPMSWDFDNLVNHDDLKLKDPDGDGIYETTLLLNAVKDLPQTAQKWKLSKNISAFPQYHSDYPLTDALYNMSLEEMINAVEPDSTFRTGKLWAGVWTRDISYSIILSMAYLQPKVAMNSLLRKVDKDGKIIQDTGTGGAYPCSTDRMIWAIAAWEVYVSTGDKEWLQKAYGIIKKSVEDDVHNVYDNVTGLVHGESSFLDWREQTYPRWMQPADIYQSENLGTNAVHYRANIVLSEMARILRDNKASGKYNEQAAKIKAGINRHLWMNNGYYAQYLYGRNYQTVSPKSEALGEALCVLFDIANLRQQQSIIAKSPITPYGISCVYPQIPGIPPYHNNAVWPFVEAYWALASAKAGNEKSVIEAMCSIMRAGALFLTNKENFVADNGDFAGSQINSSNMLWSLSGSISMIHKVIFGIDLQTDKMLFHPFVPQALNGVRSLTNFHYRHAILNITMEGFGNTIRFFELDGIRLLSAEIPENLKGVHNVSIMLKDNKLSGQTTNVGNYFSPETPALRYKAGQLIWESIKGATSYRVIKNGKLLLHTTKTLLKVSPNEVAEYQVIALDKNGIGSFASEPIPVSYNTKVYEMEEYSTKSDLQYKGFTGTGFVEISKLNNKTIKIPITIKKDGVYAINFRYANGNGPTNTENKCAIRTLKEGNSVIGTVVLPQRGTGEWSNWGYTNTIKIHFEKGRHLLLLSFEPWNENMNGPINQAMVDAMRLVKL